MKTKGAVTVQNRDDHDDGIVMAETPFRIVQPWGPDKAREATLISEPATAAEAFAEIDRLSAQMVRTGAPSDAIELIVIDCDDRLVRRPSAQ